MVALRSPRVISGTDRPRESLLFVASISAHRYNCSSRITAILANRISVLSVLNYFDDIGFLLAHILGAVGLATFSEL